MLTQFNGSSGRHLLIFLPPDPQVHSLNRPICRGHSPTFRLRKVIGWQHLPLQPHFSLQVKFENVNWTCDQKATYSSLTISIGFITQPLLLYLQEEVVRKWLTKGTDNSWMRPISDNSSSIKSHTFSMREHCLGACRIDSSFHVHLEGAQLHTWESRAYLETAAHCSIALLGPGISRCYP